MPAPARNPDRRGRPAVTSALELAEVARALFVERGYEETTVADIAAAARVTKRTFFRYFASKAEALWAETPMETARFEELLAAASPGMNWREGLCTCGPAAIEYSPEQQTWMLHRAQLVFTEPAVREKSVLQQDAWRRVATEYVAAKLELSASDALPVLAGHAALAALMGAHEYWAQHPQEDLTEVHERFLRQVLPE